MTVPAAVLAHFAADLPPLLSWQPLASTGLSGARLYRAANFLLKAHPLTDVKPGHLANIHHYLRRTHTHAALRECVPIVFGEPIAHAGQTWELLRWQTGAATFTPTHAQVRTAVTTLAQLHLCWRSPHVVRPCRALVRRKQIATRWLANPRACPAVAPALTDVVRALWAVVTPQVPVVLNELQPWLRQAWLQTICLVDVSPDHVLFTGERVTGLIDFTACAGDHVAVDLARYLGGLAIDAWDVGLSAYAEVRPLAADERALVRVLDRSGIVLSAANWLLRLTESPTLGAEVRPRLERLLARIKESGRTAINM